MSGAAQALAAFVAPLLAGWTVQFPRWIDDEAVKTTSYAVIRPSGGAAAELVRRPGFVLSLIGAEGLDATVVADAADTVIEAMRASSGALVFMQPAEPAFYATQNGRPVADIAVSTITT